MPCGAGGGGTLTDALLLEHPQQIYTDVINFIYFTCKLVCVLTSVFTTLLYRKFQWVLQPNVNVGRVVKTSTKIDLSTL